MICVLLLFYHLQSRRRNVARKHRSVSVMGEQQARPLSPSTVAITSSFLATEGINSLVVSRLFVMKMDVGQTKCQVVNVSYKSQIIVIFLMVMSDAQVDEWYSLLVLERSFMK